MSDYNPFDLEWRACLRSHYVYVIRSGDEATERTLAGVMRQAGFDEKTLIELRIRATMRVEQMGEDFVPDFAALEEQLATQVEAQIVQQQIAAEPPSAAQPGAEVAEDAAQETETEPEAPPPSEEYYAPPDDTPQQLSLF
jgi:hypothetical protein